jgi:uracil-DNA glycosylase family protein
MARREDIADSAASLIPKRPSLTQLRKTAADCKACDLWERATQTVFGEGKRRARIVAVGEQPGNEEDLSGRPFVGPAGRLLDQALAEAGIPRDTIYVTNVVKHFKWEPRGKRRIHKKPNWAQIHACKPWLDAEIALLKPIIVLCLGATAAQALLGRQFKVSRQRGRFVNSALAPFVMATIHPSSILRSPDNDTRRTEMRRFIEDLEKVRDALESVESRE